VRVALPGNVADLVGQGDDEGEEWLDSEKGRTREVSGNPFADSGVSEPEEINDNDYHS
jgi:hypothetical protein